MNNNFWRQLPKPFFILAPMEAVTDVIFRHVIATTAKPDIWFSEFTNATGWVNAQNKAIGGRLIKTNEENPIVAQIWGGEADDMLKLAIYCQKLGFHGIDINMGCPAKSAIKSGGAALINNPQLAIDSIAAAKKAKLPVSVKTRLGYSRVDEWQGWLATLLEQDLANLTIHLRTKKEMSKVPAHYELIDDIIKLRDQIAPQTLITINGDIKNHQAGMNLIDQHPGVNGIMIGRGIFSDPFCFDKNNYQAQELELINLLRLHLDLFDQWQAKTSRPFETLKRFFKIYIRDFDGSKLLREQLMNTTNTAEARLVLDKYSA